MFRINNVLILLALNMSLHTYRAENTVANSNKVSAIRIHVRNSKTENRKWKIVDMHTYQPKKMRQRFRY